MDNKPLWRAREWLSVVVLAWAAFHLWEQWSAFGGRAAFVERMTTTSHGSLALAAELGFGVLPVLAWLGIEARLLMTSAEPVALRMSMAENPELARRLGLIVRGASWVLFWWLLVHLVWLFMPKLTEGSEPLRAWLRLRDGLGTWPLAIAHALGLTGLAVLVWATPVRLAIMNGWATTPEARSSARLSGAIMAIAWLVLLAQLVGWHAAGAGAIWPM